MGRWIRIRYPNPVSGIRPNPVGHYPVISGIRYPVKFAIRCIPNNRNTGTIKFGIVVLPKYLLNPSLTHGLINRRCQTLNW